LAIKSAKISSNGDGALVQFNVPNNKGGAGDCSSIFDAATIDLLGVGPTCAYRTGSCTDPDCEADSNNSEQLVVTFGVGAVIVAGDNLVFKPNVIASDLGQTDFVSGSVPLSNPDVILVPFFHISTPASVGSCSDIVVQISSLSGQASRDWSSVEYSITPSTPSLVSFLNDYAATRSGYFTIPTTLLTSGTLYSFKAKYVNWFLQSFEQTQVNPG
jgi:hypothetical protein